MDQQKIGSFLKQLRKEKNLTQDQLAEKFYISSKTVSRWETGSNMPDLTMLIELSEFYEVDIRELIYGERQTEQLDSSSNDALKKAAEYAKEKKDTEIRKLIRYSIIVMCISAVATLYVILLAPPFTGLLYHTIEYSTRNIVAWIIISLFTLYVPYLSFSLLKNLKNIYIKESELQKHKIINIICAIALFCALLGGGLTDKAFGLPSSVLPNNARIIISVISWILLIILLLYHFWVLIRSLNIQRNNKNQ